MTSMTPVHSTLQCNTQSGSNPVAFIAVLKYFVGQLTPTKNRNSLGKGSEKSEPFLLHPFKVAYPVPSFIPSGAVETGNEATD